MGLFGWTLLKDNVTLKGRVTKHYRSSDDGDWTLDIKPAPGSTSLLVNSEGKKNSSGTVECEVEPLDDVDSDANEAKLFSPLVGRDVTVVGAWVEDDSHDGKTEIHPITSVLAPRNTSGSDVAIIDVFVFSDDSDIIHPPFWHQNRTASFSIPFPTPREEGMTPAVKVLSQVNKARSVDLRAVNVSNQYALVGKIQSGIEDDNQGFYYGAIQLSFASPTSHLYAGVWRAGTDGYYLWAGVDWDNFVAKWKELGSQGLRLIDMTVFPVT